MMKLYTKAQLAKECNIPYSTLHGRLDEFKEFFSPINDGNNLYYMEYDRIKIRIIQGMRTTKPPHSKYEINEELKKITADLKRLETIKNLFD
ncbi:hypothetical protein ABEX38_21945 [Priestia megaterium]